MVDGIKPKGEIEELTIKEVSRLIDWLKAHNHTFTEIENCIDYISNTPNTDADTKEWSIVRDSQT